MAKDKKNSGNGGAPEEAHVEQIATSPAEQSTDDAATPTTEEAPPVPHDEPPQPVDIETVTRRFVARLPDLLAARSALASLEAEHEADGDVIAERLYKHAKANRQPPMTVIGGIEWRAKHDAEKRGGKLHLFEVVKHAPIQLGTPAA